MYPRMKIPMTLLSCSRSSLENGEPRGLSSGHQELSRDSVEEVEVDADQPVRRLAAHRVGHARALVSALGDVARIAEPVHQLHPRGAIRPLSQPSSVGSDEKP